jgi:arylformamidase
VLAQIDVKDLSMPIFDVSVPLSSRTPVYPGDPEIQITDWQSLANGDAANVSLLHFGAHTGTHIDAPAHFIEGAPRLESLPLEVLIGEAVVIEVPKEHKLIDLNFVQEHCERVVTRVLFKTRNSSLWNLNDGEFQQDFTYLDPAAAKELVRRGVKLVGIDYLSVERFGQEQHPTHFELLSNDVVIVEGLNLGSVTPGKYELICLPLRIRGGSGDGAPARAVLRTLDN